LVLFHAGCASTQRHYQPPKAPPTEIAVDLSTAATQKPCDLPAPVVATLHKVVILQQTGPLGLNSYWDEYVLSIANVGEHPVTIESTDLTDLHGKSVMPGDNPWILANTHKGWFEQTDSRGVTSPGRIGVGSIAAGALAPAASGGVFCPALWTPTGYAVCVAIFAPIYAASAITFNTSGRQRMENEFRQHRLLLPRTLAPGQVVAGSLFFPVTPGPGTLAFHCRVAGQTTDLALPLTPLANLHVTPKKRT
jgi:hypothetical protein